MKKMRNRWLRKVWAGLLCMSLMVSCMLPVEAAVPNHTHFFSFVKNTEFTNVGSYDDGTHTLVTYQLKRCGFSGCIECYYDEIGRVTKAHDIEYIDLGSTDDRQHYCVRCRVCPFQREF